jgi:hypothetical protein
MMLGDLIRQYINSKEHGHTVLCNLGWLSREYGHQKLRDISYPLSREALRQLEAGKAHRGSRNKWIKAIERP